MKNDYLKWGALLFALVATASAEYELARQVGFNQWVAAAVPGALDIYTVRALRAHRDVLAAVAAMIGVNAASHLVTAGLLPVNVPLVVAVSAIAPLVLWRVHRLADEDQAPAETEALDVIQTLPNPSEPIKPDVIRSETAVEVERVPEVYPVLETAVPAVPEAVPVGVRLLPIVARPEPAPNFLDVLHEVPPTPVLAAEEPRTRVSVAVPEDDDELLARTREDFHGQIPTYRDLKEKYGIGQARARRIRAVLEGDLS